MRTAVEDYTDGARRAMFAALQNALPDGSSIVEGHRLLRTLLDGKAPASLGVVTRDVRGKVVLTA